jgi:glycosyltransferase involved in cell wall biosynthesis
MLLSIIIPSYKDPYVHQTIADLLSRSELGDQLEIILVLDGYWPDELPIADPRVRVVHLGRNRGMRGAINAGVQLARGEFLMRVDEHQTFGQGYDRILIETCQPNWIVTPRRFFLDPMRWALMDDAPVDTMALKIVGDPPKFSGTSWNRDRAELDLQESMAMQGSCWVMPRRWWETVIGELQTDGYGPLIQDSHEMVFKTWKRGGKLMVNKLTWHAHKHRSFKRTHNNGTPENPAKNAEGYAYALKVWRSYYEKEIVPQWQI